MVTQEGGRGSHEGNEGGGKGRGKEMRDKEEKITELSEHFMDCDKRCLSLLNDAGINNSKLFLGIKSGFRFESLCSLSLQTCAADFSGTIILQ